MVIDLTKFELLKAVARRLGASDAAVLLPEAIRKGAADLDPNDIVFGEAGLYYVDPNGVVARVVVHIADKDASYLSAVAIDLMLRRKSLSRSSVNELHRYHIYNCGTLEEAKRGGWRDKYKLARTETENFFYRVIRNNRVLTTMENQQLYVCKNCHNRAQSLHSDLFKEKWPAFEFSAYLNQDIAHENIDGDFIHAAASRPNLYDKDWPKISKKYKEKVGWRCQNLGCRSPDLSESRLREYLEVHHKNRDKSDNSILNLVAYCIACHADQPQHGHMKSTPRYLKYQELKRI
ncbi:MAG: hypothetical protein R3332_03570 [Pseudohongiellaceae bacterium]|nr:hypothetical protein [Pseudohongiellaceae bacterium]